ncbi:hypothetical protein OF83DRAFT_931664 [Amylostereum chailletii]|nr:hypothetical protein OF83DRAFT_931664 [Amylostereum chailletii]
MFYDPPNIFPGLSTPSASSAAGVVVEPEGAPDVQNDTAPLASFSSTTESSVRVADNVVEDAFRESADSIPPLQSPANPLAHPDLSNGEDEQPLQLEGPYSINQYGIFFTRVYPRGVLEIVRRNMELFLPAQTEGTDADSGVRTSQQDGRGEGDQSLEARGEEEEASENSEPTVAVDVRVHWARRLAQSLGWSRINGSTDDASDGGNTEDSQGKETIDERV